MNLLLGNFETRLLALYSLKDNFDITQPIREQVTVYLTHSTRTKGQVGVIHPRKAINHIQKAGSRASLCRALLLGLVPDVLRPSVTTQSLLQCPRQALFCGVHLIYSTLPCVLRLHHSLSYII